MVKRLVNNAEQEIIDRGGRVFRRIIKNDRGYKLQKPLIGYPQEDDNNHWCTNGRLYETERQIYNFVINERNIKRFDIRFHPPSLEAEIMSYSPNQQTAKREVA